MLRISESPNVALDEDYGRRILIHTSVEDGHGGAAEELTASGTELNLLYSHVSRKPSEVTVDLFSGPALGALDRYLVVRPERIRLVYVRCCRRSGGQRSWKAGSMLVFVKPSEATQSARTEIKRHKACQTKRRSSNSGKCDCHGTRKESIFSTRLAQCVWAFNVP